MSDLGGAVAALKAFTGPLGLTSRIAGLERQVERMGAREIPGLLAHEGVTSSTLSGALEIKRLAGEVNVAIHALGILLALPHLLEPDEVVLETSLGAGNTGRSFDLTTDRRIAEFKFIHWRGGAEAIRQNGLFIDIFHLAEADTSKRRYMYLTEIDRPLRFLEGRRAISSVLSKSRAVEDEFQSRYGATHAVVRDYWISVRSRINLVDASALVPELAAIPISTEEQL